MSPITGTPISPAATAAQTGYGTGTEAAAPTFTLYTLGHCVHKLVHESGHWELVTDIENNDYSDIGRGGAVDLINEAQRWLDRLLDYPKTERWLYKLLSAGSAMVTFNRPRIVKEVWIATASDGRAKLELKTQTWMREEYPEATVAGATSGVPTYWCHNIGWLAPEQYAEDASTLLAAGITDYDLLTYGSAMFPTGSLYVMPPADVDYTLEILASWYTRDLSNYTDVSFWTYHPEILVRAARRHMEIDRHRNSQGRSDFEAAVFQDVRNIYNDLIAEEMAGPRERWVMKG